MEGKCVNRHRRLVIGNMIDREVVSDIWFSGPCRGDRYPLLTGTVALSNWVTSWSFQPSNWDILTRSESFTQSRPNNPGWLDATMNENMTSIHHYVISKQEQKISNTLPLRRNATDGSQVNRTKQKNDEFDREENPFSIVLLAFVSSPNHLSQCFDRNDVYQTHPTITIS